MVTSILKKVKEEIKYLISIKESPKRLALSIGLSVFVGLMPIMGIQVPVGLGLAIIFRLNKIILVSGAAIINPWTIIPLYSFYVWLGATILRVKFSIDYIDWNNISLYSLYNSMDHLLLPLLLGSSLIAITTSIASGFISYYFINKRYLKKHQ